MKMFKFSLQKVLDVRCMIEDAKAIEMKKSQAEIIVNKQALTKTQCEKDSIIAKGKAGSEPGQITLHSLHNRSDYVDQLTSKIIDQGTIVEKSEELAEEKRLSLVEASKHKNAIEKLKEHHEEKFRKKLNQDVSKIENEVAARISSRKTEK